MIAGDELDALRERWRLLCAEPGRHDLAAALAAPFLRDLDEASAALIEATSDDARARALGGLVRASLAVQLMRARQPYRSGPYAQELRQRLGGAALEGDEGRPGERGAENDGPSGDRAGEGGEGEGDEGPDTEPRPDPADPFLAWRLGDLALAAPEPQRAALVDASIAAFEAIALAPIDPGNDLGPFTATAGLMSEAQARRAAAICETMAGADWGLELSYARAYVYSRLAALGPIEEAEGLLPRIVDPAVRAFAEGQVLGRRVARGLPWALRAGFPGPKGLSEYLEGLTRALREAGARPPERLLRACVERACDEPRGEARVQALLPIADAWGELGPAERWFEAIAGCGGGAPRVTMLFELAARRQHEPGAGRIARAAIEGAAALADTSPARWLDELFAARAVVSRADATALFVDAVAHGARGGRSWLLQDFHYTHELEGMLRWVGGEGGPAEALRALDEVERLLA